MKKKALSSRVFILAVILMSEKVLSLLFLGIKFFENICMTSWMKGIIIWEILFLSGVVFFFIRYLMKPYRDMKKLSIRFINGEIYMELFEAEYEWIPGWSKVLDKIRHLVDKQDAIKMSKKQAEYLALQNQINPHFLYNTLDAIRGDAICAGLNSVAETAEALALFFRYSITGIDKMVTVEEEIDNIENYFTIQYNRFGEKLKLDIEYPCDDDILQYYIPKLTLQPFVENAIFHGLEKKVEGGMVKLELNTTERLLLVTISDNGVGMPEEQVDKINRYLDKMAISYVGEDRKKRGGIAMKNVNSRIKLLFGEDYGIHVYSVESMGTDIMITLPKLRKGEYEEGTIEN